MKYEKSCGAVIFRYVNQKREYLIVMNKKGTAPGRWGFPKGHMELGENEYQTAMREIFEETGLCVVFYGSERVVSTYSPRDGVEKDAVYFLATPRENSKVSLQLEEVCAYKWVTADEGRQLLNFDVKILEKMDKFF